MNIAKLAEERMRERGEQVSIIFEGREITHAEMDRAAKKLGNALKNLGVKRGDRVILQMPNCPEVLQGFQALWRIGAVVVPINFLVGEEETAYIYEDSGAKVVISSQAFLPKIRSARSKVPGLETVILIDREVPEGTLSYWPLVEKSSEALDVLETEDDELAALIYTAGTTGRPKGVTHSHYSLYANARMQYETVYLPDGMTSISVLPLCHSYGIASMNNGLFRRGRTVLLNSFNVEAIFASIEKYRAEIMAGGAPLALETWNRFKQVFGHEIIEGWGLTEAGANNSVNPLEGFKKVGSIGLPMKGTEMRIVDDGGNVLPPGQQGGSVLRGPPL